MKNKINAVRRALLGVAGLALATSAPAWADAGSQNSKASAPPIEQPDLPKSEAAQKAPQQSSAEYNRDQRNRDNQTSMNRYANGNPESPRGTDSTAPVVSK